MLELVYTLYVLSLIYTVYTDVKDREISIYTLSAIVGTGIVLNMEYKTSIEVGLAWLLNVAFIGIQYGCLMLYLELRYKEGRQIFSKWIGIGDLLFFLAIGLHYELKEFVLVYLGSLMFSGIIFLLFRSRLKTIPLAGFAAIFILLFECYMY